MANKSREKCIIGRPGTESLIRATAGTITTGGAGDTGAARNMVEWVRGGESM